MTDHRRLFRAETDTQAREAALTESARMLREEAMRLGEAQALPDEAHSAGSLATMTLVHALALQVCWMVGEEPDDNILERLTRGIMLVCRQTADASRHYFDHPELWREP